MKQKILSAILGVCILTSLLSVCFTGTVSAVSVNSYVSQVSLTFDGDAPYGIPVHRGVNSIEYATETISGTENGYLKIYNTANNGGTVYIGKDGTVGASPVSSKSSDANLKAEAKANLFMCEAGKTYRLKFDYKYLKGTGGISRTMDIFSVPDPTAPSLGANYKLANRATLLSSTPASTSWVTADTVLTEDTEWQTAYYTFTVNSDETDGISIGLHPGYSQEYKTYLGIDNLTIEEVVSFEFNESRLHTMDDQTADAFITTSGTVEFTTDSEGEHGDVLKLSSTGVARITFEDFDIKQNRKYYISFDAKATVNGARSVSVIGAKGSNGGAWRHFLTGNETRNDGVQYYINGEKVTGENFKYSSEWARYGIIIDTANETLLSEIAEYRDNFWTNSSFSIHFLFGVRNGEALFDNMKLTEVESLSDAVPSLESAFSAVSIRTPKCSDDNNGTYLSAGLRFKGVISNDVKATADEIGFELIPSTVAVKDSDWYDMGAGRNALTKTAVCYKKGVKDVVYAENSNSTEYQLILTGLSTEDGKTAYMRRFSAVMYVKSGETYSYYALGEISFKEVAAKCDVLNVSYDYDSIVKPEDSVETIIPDDSWKTHPQDYKLIAFTFDDAPNASDAANAENSTVKIVDTLSKYCGAGTLFTIGKNVEKYGTDLLQYAVNKGFELGNHTYTHANISSEYLESHPDYSAEDYINEQLQPLNELIYNEMGYKMKFARASNLSSNDVVFKACSELNMPLIAGNQDVNGNSDKNTATSDYNPSTTPEHIYSAIVDYAYDGKIVLLHSTSSTTAGVLDSICAKLYSEGYRFVTLSELFEYKLHVTDMSQVDIENSLSGKEGSKAIYDIDDVKLKYYNEDQWFLHPEDYKLIAFTFDDGPVFSAVGDNVTTKIIDAFEPYYGAGTFFFTGRSLDAYGWALPEYALTKGHELANHSYNHTILSNETDASVTRNEITRVIDIYAEKGYTCKFFRGGGYSENEYMWTTLSKLGMPAIFSYLQFSDYGGGTSTAEDIIDKLLNSDIPSGAIIGMHSTNTNNVTPDALSEALPELYEAGYRFCTLSQLFELQGIDYNDIPTGKYIKKVSVTDGVPSYAFK